MIGQIPEEHRDLDEDASEGKTIQERPIPEEHRALREDQFAPVPAPGPTVLEKDRSLIPEEEVIPEVDRTSAVYDHLGHVWAHHDPMPPEQDRQSVKDSQNPGPTPEELRESGFGVGIPEGATL